VPFVLDSNAYQAHAASLFSFSAVKQKLASQFIELLDVAVIGKNGLPKASV